MRELTALEVENHETLEQIVIKHQINVEIAALGADALLAADKGEALAQLQQKALQLRHQRLFQIAFQQRPGMRQAKEFQQHRIAHELARVVAERLQLGARFLFDCGAVLAGQQALVIQRADLPLERARTPVLHGRLVHIPLACAVAIDPQEHAVMGPAQFATHCVPYWKQ